jgi:hypothetical protein
LNHERAFVAAFSARYPGAIPLYNKDLLLTMARECAPTVRSVRSPFSQPLFSERKENKKMFPSEESLERAAILLKGKSAYLKPIQGSCGIGVVRLSLDEPDLLVLRSKDQRLLSCLNASFKCSAMINAQFPQPELSEGILTIRQGAGKKYQHADLGTLLDSIEEGFVPFPERIAKKVGRQKPFGGFTTFEEAIPTPLIPGPHGGSTWEIRVINQSLGQKIEQHSYAKVGGDEFIGNIATGGAGMASLTAIGLAYRNLLPDAPAERIEALARGYLERTCRYARGIVRKLTQVFTTARKEFVPDYPFSEIRVSNISTDFMGRIRGKNMIPTVIDINFFYGASGLQATDPQGYDIVMENQRRIVADFVADVFHLPNPA